MTNSKSLLVIMAMPEEEQGEFKKLGIPVVFTGLGKVNAAYFLMREFMKNGLPKAVVNFGTAGSPKFPTHSLIECVRFAQRDIDLSPLGFTAGVTPFETDPVIIEVPKRLPDLLTGTCGTGDSFETGKTKVECDVVDMEAYALAKVCMREEVPFLSVKYISDGSDHNASNDWAENLPRAAVHFIKTYQKLETVF